MCLNAFFPIRSLPHVSKVGGLFQRSSFEEHEKHDQGKVNLDTAVV